jgi:glycosyltransferase involved in cell wall biosynthesis
MKISIVIPSYNQAKFIERTINSILLNDCPDIEIIIIDGGSTDNTIDIIKKYEKDIGYWVSEPDNGQADALNKGFKIATGEIVGWLNSDDMYCKGTIDDVVKNFQEDLFCDVVYGGIFIIDENDKITDGYWPTSTNSQYSYNVSLDVHQQGLFWKRDLFQKTGYLDTELQFIMDYDFIIKVLHYAKINRVKKYYGMFRKHGDAKTSTISSVGDMEHEIIKERLKKYTICSSGPYFIFRLRLRLRRLRVIFSEVGFKYYIFKLGKRFGLQVSQKYLSPVIFSNE